MSENTSTAFLYPNSDQSNPNTIALPYTPNEVNFTYNLNKISFDTYGGRVTQILSVKIGTVSVQGDAGSRPRLWNLYSNIKQLQSSQVEYTQPALLSIPYVQPTEIQDRPVDGVSVHRPGISANVWIKSIEIGFDPTTVTNPYSLELEIEDLSYSGVDYGNLDFVTDSIINNLFNHNNSLTSNQIGYGSVTQGNINLSQFFAGLSPLSTYAHASSTTGIMINGKLLPIKKSPKPTRKKLHNTTGAGQGTVY